jgi:hypothetical protein
VALLPDKNRVVYPGPLNMGRKIGAFYYGKGSQAKLQERFCSGGIMTEKRPYRTWRTGTVTFTILEAHLYHKANVMDSSWV